MRRISRLALLGRVLAPSPALPQQPGTGRIAGIVTIGSTGQPLPGANVTVAGTGIGVLAGPSGRFLLVGVPAGTHTVEATLLGYTKQSQAVTVTAGVAAAANFQLEVEAVQLAGIVAVGYGTQSRRNLTGSVAQIRANDITQVVSGNPADALRGRLPGVDVVALSNDPGGKQRIRVRGARSIQASNDPLIVVDGIPTSGDLRDIDPNSIQSSDVLKDAAATAVYGNRGASGVLLVTTKRGIAGRTRMDYRVTYGISSMVRKLDLGTAAYLASSRREAYRAAGVAQCANYQVDPTPCDQSGALLPTERAGLAAGVWTDWQDLVSRPGPLQNHQLAISGGNENTRFRGSIGYLDQTGITINQAYRASTGALSATHDFGRLELHATVSAARTVRDASQGTAIWAEALSLSPLGRARDSLGMELFQPVPEQSLWVNPVIDARNTVQQTTRTNVLGAINGTLELSDGVQLNLNFGPRYAVARTGVFIGTLTSDAVRGMAAPVGARITSIEANYTLSTFLGVDRRLGADHRVQGTLLYEIARNRLEGDTAYAEDLPSSGQLWHDLGSGSNYMLGSGLTESALRSWMARVNYTLKDRYTLTLSGRLDGSSVLAPGHKYAFFPATAVGWQVGEESFMKRVPVVSNLKLRLSYGRVGSSAIAPYQTLGRLDLKWYPFGSTSMPGYLPPSQIPNPNLKWETTDKYNLGVDFGLLQDRFTGTLDIYQENTHDLLLPRALPYTSGYDTTLENVGATRNRGLEVLLSSRNVEQWRGVSWASDLTFSLNRNRIVSLAGGQQFDVGSRRWVGQPINVNYDYRYIGVALARMMGFSPGDARVADVDGDGQITANDRTFLGNHYNFPSWQGSLNNRFGFRNLEASVLAVARWGFTVYDDNYGYDPARYDYWTPEHPSKTWPRPQTPANLRYAPTMGSRDGSFVRIRDITLGYTLPHAWLDRLGAQRTRVYLRAQDPFLFTSFVGWDPEAGYSLAGKVDVGSPAYRTFQLGVDLGF